MISRRYFLEKASAAAIALGLPLQRYWFGSDFSFQSRFIKISCDDTQPRCTYFSTDSLGYGDFKASPLLLSKVQDTTKYFTQKTSDTIRYYSNAALRGSPDWEVKCESKFISLVTRYNSGSKLAPFEINVSQQLNHCTVLGVMPEGNKLQFPCLLHLPGMGSFRIQCSKPEVSLFSDAYRFNGQNEKGEPFVKVAFQGADASNPVITYTLESVALFPDLPAIQNDQRFDGFRRNFINMFQLNPRIRALANNSASDACAFTLFEYAEVARLTPPLAAGLTAMDLVRNTLNRYFEGMKAYGQVGYNVWRSEYDSSDSAPSLIMSACYYILHTKDMDWAGTYYSAIMKLADKMISTDTNNDGIIEYGYSGNTDTWSDSFKRPANWWDTIGFGHDDAYSNALAYRACTLLSTVAGLLNKEDDQQRLNAFTSRLKANFYDRFYNPKTGVLGGWRSADGQLHDYYFLFVNAVAITYGLIENEEGARIMKTLLEKMKEVGYTDFSLGLPGNLIPIADGDYTDRQARWGFKSFEVYENGGATGCYAYFTIQALFNVGMRTEGTTILMAMMDAYREGSFEGRCPDTDRTRDWKTWKGECWGYEGFLVDNYLTFLAVSNL